MSDGTLRQYANELMSEEVARLKLGYLVQVLGALLTRDSCLE